VRHDSCVSDLFVVAREREVVLKHPPVTALRRDDPVILAVTRVRTRPSSSSVA
jgi:hypothetical protein